MLTFFEKHNKLSWAITIFGAVAIFYISSLTFQSVGYTSNLKSILYHFFAFFFFSAFLGISIIKGKKKYPLFLVVFLISVMYGITDEIHQFFVPGRYTSLFDVGIDSLGTLFATMIYAISIEYRKR